MSPRSPIACPGVDAEPALAAGDRACYFRGTLAVPNVLRTEQFMTQVQIDRLIRAAKHWASFQEGDSLEDQKTDERLRDAAIEARERLLKIIDDLPDA